MYFIILLYFTLNFSQSLPVGRYHRDRERTIDIIHYKADLNIDLDQKSLTGSAEIEFVPLTRTDTVSLDAVNLNIDRVELIEITKKTAILFQQKKYKLNLLLDKLYSVNDTLKMSINYTAHPNAGMYFVKNYSDNQSLYCYTYGEGGLHANWLPIYNDVNDKFSTEILVTIPEPYQVISNGILTEIMEVAKGIRKYHWVQKLPHSNYLIAIYIGRFEEGSLENALRRIPVNFWVPTGRSSEANYIFRNTTKMIEFFSKKFNYPYPWDKYDQVVIPNYSIGGMEHTSVTGLQDYVLRSATAAHTSSPKFDNYWSEWTAENLISHELAHMWFGDLVTCRNLNYIWLNESFATYLQLLCDEEAMGKDLFDLDRMIMLDIYLDYVKEKHIIRPLEYAYYDRISDIYNEEHTYVKGALILHMLRNILGAEDFFRACSYYLHKHAFSNVISNDLKIAIEEAVGRNLDWFFDDWVYGGGHPVFEVHYQYLRDQQVIDLTIKQVQALVEGQNLFKVPVEILIGTPMGIKSDIIWVDEALENIIIPCSEEPLMVSVDGNGALVAEIRFDKPLQELIYQVENDRLTGRLRALRQITIRYPKNAESLALIDELVSNADFWGLQAEAARLLGNIGTSDAEKIIQKVLKQADYRIRKAAVLALIGFPIEFAEKRLKEIIENDPHDDVVATAIVALSKVSPENNIQFIISQLNRSAWYEEITLACLNAFQQIADVSLIPNIKPLTGEKHNIYVRRAAFKAWQSCNPYDNELADCLINSYEDAPSYLQDEIISILESLKKEKALPLLLEISQESGDPDFRFKAKKALLEIESVSGINNK